MNQRIDENNPKNKNWIILLLHVIVCVLLLSIMGLTVLTVYVLKSSDSSAVEAVSELPPTNEDDSSDYITEEENTSSENTETNTETNTEANTETNTETHTETNTVQEEEYMDSGQTGEGSISDYTPINDPVIEVDEKAFWGIWCVASKDSTEAENYAAIIRNYGVDARVILSSDWSNLNQEPWYCVTAGFYDTEAEANNALPYIQSIYHDAYVKYSGTYQKSSQTDQVRFKFLVTSNDSTRLLADSDSFIISGRVYQSNQTCDLIVDSSTRFADSCEMEYFANYKTGDTPLDWYHTNYDDRKNNLGNNALVGIFDVSITDSHIDLIYGTYWWD